MSTTTNHVNKSCQQQIMSTNHVNNKMSTTTGHVNKSCQKIMMSTGRTFILLFGGHFDGVFPGTKEERKALGVAGVLTRYTNDTVHE